MSVFVREGNPKTVPLSSVKTSPFLKSHLRFVWRTVRILYRTNSRAGLEVSPFERHML